MQNGWIKLHRKITESPIFNDLKLFRLWIICLTQASHQERKQLIGRQTVDLLPGEFVTGRHAIFELYNRGLPPSEIVKGEKTVYRWLEVLEEGDFLTIKKTNKFSIVSINNWSLYQSNDHQMTNKRPSNDQQMTTNKNDKNVKNEKKKESVSKKQYSELVFMTEEEHSRLVEEFGESIIQSKIEDLDNYIGSTGKKYKDHNRTIRSWLKRDNVKGGQVASKPKPFVRVLEDD